MFNTIFKYFAQNRVVSTMLLVFIIMIGITGVLNVKRDVFPETEMDKVLINITYPGASPEDVELNTVIPVENELKQISGIDEYTAISIENGARIIVNIDSELKNTQKVKDEVFRAMTGLPALPEEAEIHLIDANPKLKSVYTIGLRVKEGESASLEELYGFADRLESTLLKLDGVGEVKKEGYADPEVHIYVSPSKLKDYYISLNEIVQSIQAENVRATGGTLQGVHEDMTIVTVGQFDDVMDVGSVIIRSSYEGKRVYIKDVADIKKGFKDKDVDVRINKTTGIALSIVKKENADVMKTAEGIKSYLAENKNIFPKKFEVETIADQSLSIKALLDVVQSNLIIGFLLVFLILMVFLDIKSAFWTAFGIPVIMLVTLAYLYFSDMTLNIMSLGAIITIMGILVDDGIVISENIFRYRRLGNNAFDASLKGTSEVAPAVVISVLTTIAAFVPMAFIGGKMGKFVYVFPVIVSVALLTSLFESFFLLPNHLLHGKAKKKSKKIKKDWFEPLAFSYSKLLKRVLKFRYIILVVFILIFVLTVGAFVKGMDKFALTTDSSSDMITVNLETPLGTSRAMTTKYVSAVEDTVLKTVKAKELLSVKTAIGHHDSRTFNVEGYHDNWAQLRIYLVPSTKRDRSAKALIQQIRKAIPPKAKKKFKLMTFKKKIFGPDVGNAIDIQVVGNNEQKSRELADSIKEYLTAIPGVSDIEDNLTSGKDEIRVRFNMEKMAQLDIDVATVAQTIRIAYHGAIATSIQNNEKEIDFRVEIDPKYQKDKGFLKDLTIPNKSRRLIKLGTIAYFEEKKGAANIEHYNGEQAITISGDVDGKLATSKQVMKQVSKKFSKYVNMKYGDVYILHGGEAKETASSLKDLTYAFIIALVFIYFILALLFNSPSQPFIILVLLPFGVIGALIGFKIHGMPLTFMGLIGIIGLIGVIVNDNIVLVTFINKIFKENKVSDKQAIISAIAEGARVRLRPIILTTLTTVAGLVPTVFGWGGTSEMIQPVVVALCYGLIFATLLTLFFLPSLYMISEDMKRTR